MSDDVTTDDGAPTRAEVCCVAVAECFRGDGEILANPIGIVPMIGGRLARETFEPHLVMTDGFAGFAANALPPGADPADAVFEAWNPYAQMFSVLWNGRRHVMMGGSQFDRFGNQNFVCIGDWRQPKSQLLGFRGAPGNTINHTPSYWVPGHTAGIVSALGRSLRGQGGRFHEQRRVVTNHAVLDFETPDRSMRLRSVHPGVTVDEVVAATGFELTVPAEVPESRLPTDDELRLIREVIDPKGLRYSEVPRA